MSKKQKFVFLDIDGPMIPSGCYLLDRDASYRRVFSPICVAVVNRLCHESGAKVVFNTTHNLDRWVMLEDAFRQGIKRGHVYLDSPMTKYPTLENRGDAINLWLKDNDFLDSDWVAFDDCDFNHENLILIDFDVGLTPIHLNLAIDKLGKGRKVVVL